MKIFISISNSSICEIPIVLRAYWLKAGNFRCLVDYWHASLSPLQGMDESMLIAPFLYLSNLKVFYRVVAGKCLIFAYRSSQGYLNN